MTSKRTFEWNGSKWEVEANLAPVPEKKAGDVRVVGKTLPYVFYYRRLDGRSEHVVTVAPEIGRRFDADDMMRVAIGLPRSEPELSDEELVEVLKQYLKR